MAAQPMSDPSQQQQDPGASPDQGGAQANQLQASMMKLVAMFNQLATQNVIIQPEMQAASAACLKAFHKVTQASQPQQQTPAPPGQ
jgi:hypothetical protein